DRFAGRLLLTVDFAPSLLHRHDRGVLFGLLLTPGRRRDDPEEQQQPRPSQAPGPGRVRRAASPKLTEITGHHDVPFSHHESYKLPGGSPAGSPRWYERTTIEPRGELALRPRSSGRLTARPVLHQPCDGFAAIDVMGPVLYVVPGGRGRNAQCAVDRGG